jgi:selenocysteine lyase/cysteine desulfurase
MLMPAPRSRRSFLAVVGAVSASNLAPGSWLAAGGQASPVTAGSRRGLAPADDFLFAPGLVYLQTGSLGPTPRPVMERAIAAWKELELNPVHYAYGPQEAAMEDVRAKAAALIGCKKDELLATRSTTEGMNWVAQGLGLKAGDHVLTTDNEHPGGRVCWDYLVRKHSIVLDIVAIPPGENDTQAIVARFTKAMTPRTRVLSFSHLLTSTGMRMPVAELCALARTRGAVSVVDGAQAVGGVAVDVKALGCDAYVTSAHKWLLAPPGSGLLYLNERLGDAIDPIPLQAGRAVYSASSGVTNIPGVLALGTAIDYVSSIGVATIERHNLALRERAWQALQNVARIRVVSPPAGPLASPLLTFLLPDSVKSGDLYQRLSERHKVVVKVLPEQWGNGTRISTHLFNTTDDVDRFVAALKVEMGQ